MISIGETSLIHFLHSLKFSVDLPQRLAAFTHEIVALRFALPVEDSERVSVDNGHCSVFQLLCWKKQFLHLAITIGSLLLSLLMLTSAFLHSVVCQWVTNRTESLRTFTENVISSRINLYSSQLLIIQLYS